jgi:hypothetical protein
MFCPNPFTRIEIKSDGGVYGCCEGWMPQPFGNILTSDLNDIWEGATARMVRESIIDGSFRFCTACPYLPGPAGSVVEHIPNGFQGHRRIATLKMDYDQTCNLTCPSCRAVHSNEFVDVSKARKIHEAVLASGIIDRVDRLHITGSGDPFASPIFWPMLQDFPAVKHSPKIFLHTNGQLLDEYHWRDMASSQDLISDIGISVDAGTASTYRENRRSSWDRLWKNISFINALQQSRPIVLGMFFTVQANNFRELISFTQQAFEHRVCWISVTALRNWGAYTTADYARRAVHVPGHPEFDDFQAVMKDVALKDKRIVIDSFNPQFNVQKPLIPAASLTRRG